MCNWVYGVFSERLIISSINKTFLVLFPKSKAPEYLAQFRPISICNVIYKIVTRVIVNQFKQIALQLSPIIKLVLWLGGRL